MNDRLGDLPSWAADDDDDADDLENGKSNDNEGDVEMKGPSVMDHFFKEVETIKSDIDAIQKASKKIGNLNDRAMQATTTEEENQLSKELKPVIDKTNQRAKKTKTMLGLLKEETTKLKDSNDIKSSDLRYVHMYWLLRFYLPWLCYCWKLTPIHSLT